MKIGGISEAGRMSQAAAYGGQEDAYTKNIKNQIAQAQKEMQQLSSNQELSMEDKMKKRQELTQKISDLNNQLRQHEIEQKNSSRWRQKKKHPIRNHRNAFQKKVCRI